VAEKKYRVHLSNGKSDLFKVRESGGRYHVYAWAGTGFLSDNYKHLGDARTESDAISLIRANASGSVSRISID
jgi:hypothetical protein